MLSILNSLAEYFHMINGLLLTSENPEVIEQRTLYIIFNGKTPGLYIPFEELVMQKQEIKLRGGSLSFKKYISIDETLTQARKRIGVNYYIEPAAKDYIQKYKRITNKKTAAALSSINIKIEEESSKKPIYKECLVKGVDPLDGSYID
uniref:Uncharacterized protein n=1 Tax=Arundo donax TaxID=35708 RepID=A0A0A9BPY7_ARUDO